MARKTDTGPRKDKSARFDYQGLERVIHEKARLGILTSLVTHARGLLFTDLKELCSLTDGNLSRHLAALKEEELVEVLKGSDGRRPQSLVRMTESGRSRFAEYLAELERVVSDAVDAAKDEVGRGAPYPDGWFPA